ncbi:hypothetical protein PIB30_072032 [Stylosanthes scabra]|uniref:Uncharacterized protein n=1 Tax=Stylosanthes scabra TaxID=79078 RepID=A0ABU6RPK8_9FABA|nr:hypothetical protein [Stylosanthes scabra]
MGLANLMVYHNGEVMQLRHEGLSFVYQFPVSLCVPYTMTFAELQSDVTVLSTNSAQIPMIKLFVDFDVATEVQEDSEMDIEKQTVLEENLSNSEEELEVTYEIGAEDEDEDVEEARPSVVVQTSSNAPTNQHPFGFPPFMQATRNPPMNEHHFGVPSLCLH